MLRTITRQWLGGEIRMPGYEVPADQAAECKAGPPSAWEEAPDPVPEPEAEPAPEPAPEPDEVEAEKQVHQHHDKRAKAQATK